MASPRRKPVRQGAGTGALTLRLDADRYRQLRLLARAENRSPTNYVETLLLRDLALREEASRAITMYVPPEAEGVAPGPLERSEGESEERHRERVALYDRLFALPDAGT